MQPPSLIVSIHDVSTVTRATVERMMADLKEEGVPETSLLVIPDHHGKGRIDRDPAFGEWLRKAVGVGHEAVLHGHIHLRKAKKSEGFGTRLITRSYTAGEGEFYDLSKEEAMDLLRRGREALEACGIIPSGFIAPAWLLGEEAEHGVAEEGFDYTTRIAEVIDLKNRMKFPARSMVYSVRAGWRRGLSLLWNEGLFHLLHDAPLLRVGLHPPDWSHPAIRGHALSRIRLATREREVTTYSKWLARRPASGHERGVS
jgi:hypothetical protein